jgi:two-component system, NarL family, invasion response regulator UvrY
MNILIVDDHIVIHQGLQRILADEFPAVVFGGALDANEALHQVRERRWDVVILDIALPGRGGFELLRDLHAERPSLPILIFSMHAEEQFAMRAMRAGASGYLSKNSPSDQLVAAIIKLGRGGHYVSPAFAEKLASDLSGQGGVVGHDVLSNRELEVMRLLASARSTAEIADLLVISVKTVSTYRSRLFEKLNLKSIADLVRYAIDHDLDK